MTNELILLVGTAASIAFLHTLMGPDHYLPFVALGKARGWTKKKLSLVTIGCGLGHSVGSILLGLFGIWLGTALSDLAIIENWRGDIAAWALLVFGLLYMAWGLKRAARGKPHSHEHSHADGTTHNHHHSHASDHVHAHEAKNKVSVAPWSIFIIFVLGPCEPLIPLMMYPAASTSLVGMSLVVGAFVGVTVLTMLTIALAVDHGLKFLPAEKLRNHIHTMSGATLAFCGFAVVGLGL